MRNKIKKITSLFLAFVMLVSSVFTNHVVVNASNVQEDEVFEDVSFAIQLGENTIDTMEQLTGYVVGHPLDLELQVEYNGKTTSKEYEIDAVEDVKDVLYAAYDSEYSYDYELKSENYEIELADGIPINGSLSSNDVETGYTFVVKAIKPKCNILSISPETVDLKAGQKDAAFVANLDNETWVDNIEWTVSNAENVVITPKDNRCSLDVNDELTVDSQQITLTAKMSNESSKDVLINLTKRDVSLSVSATGTWNETDVTVQAKDGNEPIQGLEISLNYASGKVQTTDADGKTTFELKSDVYVSTYEFEATSSATAKYKASSASYSYDPSNKNQKIEFEVVDSLEVTYGDKNVEIGTVKLAEGDESVTEYEIQAFSGEEENGTASVDVETGKVTYTPAFAGEVTLKVTKKESTGYNSASVDTNITVDKKIVSLGEIKAKSKPYDQLTNNINVEATVEGTNIKLSAQGVAESANAGEQKVKAVLTLSENDQKKYAFETSDNGIDSKITVETTVSIEKKGITVIVPDAEKEWQSKDVLNSLMNVKNFEYIGFCGNDEKIKDPAIIIDETDVCIENKVGTAYKVLSIETMDKDTSSDYVGSNYYIESIEKGTLNIVKESKINFAEHIEIDNSKSIGVYQPDVNGATIYYSGTGSIAVFNHKSTSLYTTLCLKDGTRIDEANGFKLDETGYVECYLSNEDNTIKSEEFKIQFTNDQDVPVVMIQEGENVITLDSLAEKITFGVFNNETITVSVAVDDKNMSGISNWTYYKVTATDETKLDVADLNQMSLAQKKQMIEETFLNSIIETESFDASKKSTTIDLKIEENDYYIIYVAAVDNVGNSILIGSNGIVIEDIDLDAINIKLNDNEVKDSKTVYFKEDVTLDVSISDNTNGIYTGVLKSDYTIKVNDKQIYNYDKFVEEAEGIIDPSPSVTNGEFVLVNNAISDVSLKELHDLQVNKILVVSTSDNAASKKFDLVFGAIDFAGNESQNKEVSFVIDKVNPSVVAEINTSKTQKAEEAEDGYYNDFVYVDVVVTERYIDKKDIVLTVEIDSLTKTYSLEQLENGAGSDFGIAIESVKMTDENNDSSKSEFTVVFGKADFDAEYKVSIAATDRAGNSAKSNTLPFNFDNIAPLQKLTFVSYSKVPASENFVPSMEDVKPTYLNNGYTSFAVSLEVNERNFVGKNGIHNEYIVNTSNSKGESVLKSEQFVLDAKDEENWTPNGDEKFIYSLDFTDNANYSFDYQMYDRAGNKGVWSPESTVNSTAYVTLDKIVPTGTIKIDGLLNQEDNLSWKEWVNQFVENISFGLFGKSDVTATFTNDDETSGVAVVYYYLSKVEKSLEELKAVPLGTPDGWKLYDKALDISEMPNVIVYQMVADKAGNVEYYSSNGVVLDDSKPDVITITPISSPEYKNGILGIYKASDNPGFIIEVKEQIKDGVGCSGLKDVTYTIKNVPDETKPELVKTLYSSTISYDKTKVQTEHREKVYLSDLGLDINDFYGNNLYVTVTATDWSTNEADSKSISMAFDNHNPEVEFIQKFSGQYCEEKILEIEVDERNFDEDIEPIIESTHKKVTGENNDGYIWSGWTVEGEIATGNIIFVGDGDYRVTYECIDLAGNPSNSVTQDWFTIDRTAPDLTAKIENSEADEAIETYYNENVKLNVNIIERFIVAKDIWISVTTNEETIICNLDQLCDDNNNPLKNYGVSVLKDSLQMTDELRNDSETQFTLLFGKDINFTEDYNVEISVKDLVGYEDSCTKEFHIDKESPIVTFGFPYNNAKNDKYYNEKEELIIRVKEKNFDIDIEPKVDILSATTGEYAGGYLFSGWEKDKNEKDTYVSTVTFNKDGDYDVTYQCYDFAGNLSNLGKLGEITIDTVDPEISTFTLTEDTLKDENAVDGYYNDIVKVNAIIKERFVDKEKVLFNIEVNDGQRKSETYSLKQIEDGEAKDIGVAVTNIQMTNMENTDSVSSFILEFGKDNYEADYSVQMTVKDRTEAVTVKSNTLDFHFDNVAPKVTRTFYRIRLDENNEPTYSKLIPNDNVVTNYVNGQYDGFSVEIKVTDKNFGSKNSGVNNAFTVKNLDIEDIENQDCVKTEGNYASWTPDKNGMDYISAVPFYDDANYSVEYSIYDMAGNESESSKIRYITLDKGNPTGTIKIDGLVNNLDANDENVSFKEWITEFIGNITFGLFAQNSVTVELSAEDSLSGVSSIYYYIAKETVADTADANIWKNSSIKWSKYEYNDRIELPANQNVIVYQKILDSAGNQAIYSSEGVVIDNTAPTNQPDPARDPAPIITVNPSTPKDGAYSIFKREAKAEEGPGFDINVNDPITSDGSYSGLREIYYQILDGSSVVYDSRNEGEISYSKDTFKEKFGEHICLQVFDDTLSTFYSNNIYIKVVATDWSTNVTEYTTTEPMKIDSKVPEIEFTFDHGDRTEFNGREYYKNNKVLTITVDERNFDTNSKPIVDGPTNGYVITQWEPSGVDQYKCEVRFTGDGDYNVTYNCTDLAGNASVTKELKNITIDKTIPVINVSYDNNSAQNGNYYNASRTATITITEHNFDTKDVKVTTTASNGAAPRVSGWSTSGDRRTATIYFGSDADYTFDIQFTDLAGNVAADYAEDKFTVDLTKPVVEITGVADKSANKGSVAPVITINDTNFDLNNATITLTGAESGIVNTANMVTKTSTGTGQVITFGNFANDMDDIYTLVAKSIDKAGNETSQTITFSVNRRGSTYEADKKTQELLDKGYTNTPVDIIIKETNVDTLEFIELSYTKDGEIIKLKEGKDYKVESTGSDGSWKQYTYTIFAECFEEEGKYNINISSVDRAENESNNKVQSKTIEFTVDKTAPTMAISNLEDKGRYDVDKHEFTLDVVDNTLLSKVELYIDGKLVHTYERDELTVENGKVYIILDGSTDYQTVKLIAYDEAGNPTEPVEYDVLVSANGWVQFANNKTLFYGSIGVLAALILFIIFIIWKKRKDDEEKKVA